MFTVKYFRPYKGTSAMVIDYADRVVEGFGPKGNKFVRLTRFITGMSANTTNETIIPLDAAGEHYASTVFVENMQGKTVQRITTAVPWMAD